MTYQEWMNAWIDQRNSAVEKVTMAMTDAAKDAWEAATKAEREACRHACNEAIKRACAEAGVKLPTFVGMCLEVGLEQFDDVLTANA